MPTNGREMIPGGCGVERTSCCHCRQEHISDLLFALCLCFQKLAPEQQGLVKQIFSSTIHSLGGRENHIWCLGFETLAPEQGLAILAAALHPASAFQPAAAASPLLWGALLNPGGARASSSLYLEFAPPPVPPQLSPAYQRKVQQHRPAQQECPSSSAVARWSGVLAADGGAGGGGSTSSRKQWEDAMRAQLEGIVRGVIGADIVADQPLMEVTTLHSRFNKL